MMSVEFKIVTTADSGWGEEFTISDVDLQAFCKCLGGLFSHCDET